MNDVPLRDILIHARQESTRMRHYYLGVEHLFIALLEIQGGLVSSILQDHGFTPEYVIDAVRRKTGKGGKQRLWAGVPNTPRADIVLGIANDLALEEQGREIDERSLLAAILEERDSLPVRVLESLGLDLNMLRTEATTRIPDASARRTYTTVAFGPDFDSSRVLADEHLFLLRRMFQAYRQARVERALRVDPDALLLLVTPVDASNRDDAPEVVKLAPADAILDEVKRYELFMKPTLPTLAARIVHKPTTPETSDWAGLRYIFPRELPSAGLADLPRILDQWGPARVAMWIQEKLYPHFAETWWLQRWSFPFAPWMEYDWLLPPVLTVEMIAGDALPAHSIVIKEPVQRDRLRKLERGDTVVIENFTVQQVDAAKKAIHLTIGRGVEASRRAVPIAVINSDAGGDFFFRGELVDRVIGRVVGTRTEALRAAVSALEPEFTIDERTIPAPVPAGHLPNPLAYYQDVLDMNLKGSASKIHGALRAGNILVGPDDGPYLIDFAQSREGHTLSDWAMLETSLLSELVRADDRHTWRAVWQVTTHLIRVNARVGGQGGELNLPGALAPVVATRQIARSLLQTEGIWDEYYAALALCALRLAVSDAAPLGPRRLMFLVSALAIYELLPRRPNENTASAGEDGVARPGDSSLSY